MELWSHEQLLLTRRDANSRKILARVAELEEEMRLKDAELQHQHDMAAAAAAAASAASNKANSSADN